MGVKFVSLFAWVVSTGYFLFAPTRVAISVRFYKALFPERSTFYYLWCTWKQFHGFASLFAERLELEEGGQIEYTSEGWDHLERAAEEKTGGIIVMSHLGNWEAAARLLKRSGLKILLYMGQRRDEQVEKTQKRSLKSENVGLVTVDDSGSEPLNGLQGLKFLKEGGFVSIAGDRTSHKNQRLVEAPFLGHIVALPQAPYLFAAIAKVPVYFFFAFRTERGKYHFQISSPNYIRPLSRSDREACVQKAAREYATLLEDVVRKFPFQWYHFEAFLGDEAE